MWEVDGVEQAKKKTTTNIFAGDKSNDGDTAAQMLAELL